MGVPVITCPGPTFASRHTLGHLWTIGLADLVAANLDDYILRAAILASDLTRLASLRSRLRSQMEASALCDGKRFAANLLRILQQVWRK
jgi:predicted O-linked N-acetylglucosamine transferase (SPINDLY family)